MRRREVPLPPTDEPPAHFVYQDWRAPDEPAYPVFLDHDFMRVLRRYMDARLRWTQQQRRQHQA